MWEGSEPIRNQFLQYQDPTSRDSLIQYLLSTYFVSVSVLDAGDTEWEMLHPCLQRSYNLGTEKR